MAMDTGITFELKRLDIKPLREGEMYHVFEGGVYAKADGQRYLLSNVQARTLEITDSFKTTPEQFEFFCFAYLWQLIDYPGVSIKYQKAWETFGGWKEKFGQPWNGNTKHTLPAIDEEDWADLKVLTPEGVDLSLLIKKFQEYGQYQYILYP
jgi:hypothetical protein